MLFVVVNKNDFVFFKLNHDRVLFRGLKYLTVIEVTLDGNRNIFCETYER